MDRRASEAGNSVAEDAVLDDDDNQVHAQASTYSIAKAQALGRWHVRRAVLLLLRWSWIVCFVLLLFQYPSVGAAPPGGTNCVIGTNNSAIVPESGEFTFTWYDDDGSVYDMKKKIEVS